jgi:hypothetical protein
MTAQEVFAALVKALADSGSMKKLSIIKFLQHLSSAHALPREFVTAVSTNILSRNYVIDDGVAEENYLKSLKSLTDGLWFFRWFSKQNSVGSPLSTHVDRSDQAEIVCFAVAVVIDMVLRDLLHNVRLQLPADSVKSVVSRSHLIMAAQAPVPFAFMEFLRGKETPRTALARFLIDRLYTDDCAETLSTMVTATLDAAVTLAENAVVASEFPLALVLPTAACPLEILDDSILARSLANLQVAAAGFLQLNAPALTSVVTAAFMLSLTRPFDSLPDLSLATVNSIVTLLAALAIVLKRMPLIHSACGAELAEHLNASLGPIVTRLAAHAMSSLAAAISSGQDGDKDTAPALLRGLGRLCLLDEPLAVLFGGSLGLISSISSSVAEDFFADDLSARLTQCRPGSTAEAVTALIAAKKQVVYGLEHGLGKLFLVGPGNLRAPPGDLSQVLFTFRVASKAPARSLCVRDSAEVSPALIVGFLPPGTVFDVVEQRDMAGGYPVYRLAVGGWVGPLERLVEAVVESETSLTASAITGVTRWTCEGCLLPNLDGSRTACVHCGNESAAAGSDAAGSGVDSNAQMWTCSFCDFPNSLQNPVCSKCGASNDPVPVVTQTRGPCAACADSWNPCRVFIALPSEPGSEMICRICHCLESQHPFVSSAVVLSPSPKLVLSKVSAAIAALPVEAVSTCAPRSPFQSVYALVFKQMAAAVAGTTLPPRPPIDLALYIVGTINVALDTLSPENALALVSHGTDDGNCESAFLAELADLAVLVTDRDRLEVSLVNELLNFLLALKLFARFWCWRVSARGLRAAAARHSILSAMCAPRLVASLGRTSAALFWLGVVSPSWFFPF